MRKTSAERNPVEVSPCFGISMSGEGPLPDVLKTTFFNHLKGFDDAVYMGSKLNRAIR